MEHMADIDVKVVSGEDVDKVPYSGDVGFEKV